LLMSVLHASEHIHNREEQVEKQRTGMQKRGEGIDSYQHTQRQKTLEELLLCLYAVSTIGLELSQSVWLEKLKTSRVNAKNICVHTYHCSRTSLEHFKSPVPL